MYMYKFLKKCLNTSKTNKQTNKNRKTTEIIDRIVAHIHLFIIVYRVWKLNVNVRCKIRIFYVKPEKM